MLDKPMKIPGPDHPITIEPSSSRVVITLDGEVLADTRDALTLREARYPAVLYIPRTDVNMRRLKRSSHATYCSFKGDCAYYDLPGGGEHAANAVWTYERPFDAVADIKDHLAFYADRVVITETRDNLASGQSELQAD
jgi:uncharacterized protein (DUF427 family)